MLAEAENNEKALNGNLDNCFSYKSSTKEYTEWYQEVTA